MNRRYVLIIELASSSMSSSLASANIFLRDKYARFSNEIDSNVSAKSPALEKSFILRACRIETPIWFRRSIVSEIALR